MAVEFALILPLLVMIYLAIAELAQIFLLQRQANMAAEAGAEAIDAAGNEDVEEQEIAAAAAAAFGPHDETRFRVQVICLDARRRSGRRHAKIANVEVSYDVLLWAPFVAEDKMTLRARSFRLTASRSLCG